MLTFISVRNNKSGIVEKSKIDEIATIKVSCTSFCNLFTISGCRTKTWTENQTLVNHHQTSC